MICKEVLELMSAAVDGELDAHTSTRMMQHFKECRSCRHELELERMTKNIIQRHVDRVQVPTFVADAIKQRLASEISYQPVSQGILSGLFRRPGRKMILAFGGAAVMILLILSTSTLKSHRSHAQPNDANFVHQAYNNYDRVLNGTVLPAIASNDPADVKAFFSRCGCNFNVPLLKKCRLKGGAHAIYNSGHIAQFIYQHDNDLVYLSEAKYRDVNDRGRLELAPEVMDELQRTGWYIENLYPDCSLAVWLVDSTVCCAVSDIPKEQLLASLK